MTEQPLVLQLIAPAPAGGAETVVRSIASPNAERRYRHHVVALLQGDADSPFVQSLEASAVPVSEVRCGRRHYGREAKAVGHLATRLGAEVIHSHVYHADLVGAWASKQTGLPIVATAHGLTGGDWKNRFYQWLDLKALRRFDGVIAVSQPLHDALLHVGCRPERLHLIPNGFVPGPRLDRATARRELGLYPNCQVVGWVGRFTPEKNPLAFVDLIHRLDQPRPRAIMMGDGPLLDQTRSRATAAGLSPAGFLTPGRIDDAGRYLQALDVLVMTSRTEGTPMVLLEAMASGTPIVSFAVGGIPQVLDAQTALLVPPGALEQLAEAVVSTLQGSDATQARVARASAILEERFAADLWLDRIEAVYDTVRKS